MAEKTLELTEEQKLKKSLSLVIMAVLLVGLIVVYFVVSAKFADDTEGVTSDTAPSYVTVNSIDQKNITAVSYTNKGVEYTFTLTDGV
jgi:flagellar basal body-associated protein FliL